MQRNNEKSRPNILSHGSPDSLLLFALKSCFAMLIFDTTIVFFQATNHQAVFSSTPVNTFSFQSDFVSRVAWDTLTEYNKIHTGLPSNFQTGFGRNLLLPPVVSSKTKFSDQRLWRESYTPLRLRTSPRSLFVRFWSAQKNFTKRIWR